MNFILFGKWGFTTGFSRLPDASTVGVTNETEEGFLVFADYDNTMYSKVVTDIHRIQKVFFLDVAMVMSTEERTINDETVGNYLVVFFDIVNHGLVKEALRWIRCDPRYRTYWSHLTQKNWVIRVGKKLNGTEEIKPEPTFKELIYPKHRSQVYKKSRAYYLFFKKLFNTPTIRTNFINDKTVTLIPYLTSK